MLPIRRFGSGPPLVALHGFTYTGRQFAEVASHLSRTVLAPDLPGHGGASHATTAWPVVLDEVRTLVANHDGPLLGYSQGARLALAATATGLAAPSHLIIVSGTAGIAEEADRQARLEADRQTAIRLLESGLDEFVEAWTSTGITSTDNLEIDRRDADLEIRRENTAEGLASALVGYGQGAMEPVWDRLAEIECATLVVSGSDDQKYRAVADQLAADILRSERLIVDGAGHNPILTHPVAVASAVSDFLDGNR